jgi:hypothetical protein
VEDRSGPVRAVLRSSARRWLSEDTKVDHVGFRVAQSLQQRPEVGHSATARTPTVVGLDCPSREDALGCQRLRATNGGVA